MASLAEFDSVRESIQHIGKQNIVALHKSIFEYEVDTIQTGGV